MTCGLSISNQRNERNQSDKKNKNRCGGEEGREIVEKAKQNRTPLKTKERILEQIEIL
jgi:hypothetical protein